MANSRRTDNRHLRQSQLFPLYSPRVFLLRQEPTVYRSESPGSHRLVFSLGVARRFVRASPVHACHPHAGPLRLLTHAPGPCLSVSRPSRSETATSAQAECVSVRFVCFFLV